MKGNLWGRGVVHFYNKPRKYYYTGNPGNLGVLFLIVAAVLAALLLFLLLFLALTIACYCYLRKHNFYSIRSARHRNAPNGSVVYDTVTNSTSLRENEAEIPSVALYDTIPDNPGAISPETRESGHTSSRHHSPGIALYDDVALVGEDLHGPNVPPHVPVRADMSPHVTDMPPHVTEDIPPRVRSAQRAYDIVDHSLASSSTGGVNAASFYSSLNHSLHPHPTRRTSQGSHRISQVIDPQNLALLYKKDRGHRDYEVIDRESDKSVPEAAAYSTLDALECSSVEATPAPKASAFYSVVNKSKKKKKFQISAGTESTADEDPAEDCSPENKMNGDTLDTMNTMEDTSGSQNPLCHKEE